MHKLAVYYCSHVLYKLYKIIFFTKVTKKFVNQKKKEEIKNNTYKHQLFHHPFYSKVFPFVVNRMFWCWSSNRLHMINREQNGVKQHYDINMQHKNLLQMRLLPKPRSGEGVLPYMYISHNGVCRPKGYGSCTILVWKLV